MYHYYIYGKGIYLDILGLPLKNYPKTNLYNMYVVCSCTFKKVHAPSSEILLIKLMIKILRSLGFIYIQDNQCFLPIVL